MGNNNLKVTLNGAEETTLIAKDYQNNEVTDTKVYTCSAADAYTYVLFTTTGSGTIVFKQIMIDEEIADVELPAVSGPTTALDNIESLDLNAPIYNILGQPVGSDYKGIVLQNGRKFLLQ